MGTYVKRDAVIGMRGLYVHWADVLCKMGTIVREVTVPGTRTVSQQVIGTVEQIPAGFIITTREVIAVSDNGTGQDIRTVPVQFTDTTAVHAFAAIRNVRQALMDSAEREVVEYLEDHTVSRATVAAVGEVLNARARRAAKRAADALSKGTQSQATGVPNSTVPPVSPPVVPPVVRTVSAATVPVPGSVNRK
jgi:hypothetical protein